MTALLLFADVVRDGSIAARNEGDVSPLSSPTTVLVGEDVARDLRRLTAASPRDRTIFAKAVMDGCFAQAVAILASLPEPVVAVDDSGLLAKLARIIEAHRCPVEVKAGSLAVKVHHLLPEDGVDGLAKALNSAALERDCFLCACGLRALSPRGDTRVPVFDTTLAVLPARDEVELAHYPRIPEPQLEDTVYVAVFENRDGGLLASNRFAESAASAIHYHRTEMWDTPSSFLFLHVNGRQPLDLARTFSRHGNADNARVWAVHTGYSLEQKLLSSFVVDHEQFRLVPRRSGFFVLLAWSAALYAKAMLLATDLLAQRSGPPNLCAEAVVPALDDFSHAVIATFSPDTVRRLLEEAAPPTHVGGHNSCSLRQAVERHLMCMRRELSQGEATVSNMALLQRMGVSAPHLLSAAGDIDARGGSGMSVLQLLAWQFLPSPPVTRVPLLGDAVARQADSEIVEAVGDKNVVVRHLGGKNILAQYQKQEEQLVQLCLSCSCEARWRAMCSCSTARRLRQLTTSSATASMQTSSPATVTLGRPFTRQRASPTPLTPHIAALSAAGGRQSRRLLSSTSCAAMSLRR